MKEFLAVRRFGAVLVLTAAAAGFPTALAQQTSADQIRRNAQMGFSNSMATKPPAAPATKFEDAASQRSFVIQLNGDVALLQFEGSPEVLALTSRTAQRGDDFFQSDSGQVLLRRTEQGNMISYVGSKAGAPADAIGAASGFNAPPMPASLTAKQKETAARLSKLVGHEVTAFGAGDFANDSAWAADALMVMTLGVERAVKQSPAVTKNLRAARIQRANVPSVSFSKDGELVVYLNPSLGYAGRPSSEVIAVAMQIGAN